MAKATASSKRSPSQSRSTESARRRSASKSSSRSRSRSAASGDKKASFKDNGGDMEIDGDDAQDKSLSPLTTSTFVQRFFVRITI